MYDNLNIGNLTNLIDLLKLPKTHVAMNNYFWDGDMAEDRGIEETNLCGSPACICGWSNHLATGTQDLGQLGNEKKAADWLGIDADYIDNGYYIGYKLFTPNHKKWSKITKEEVIETLEHLRDTKELVWADHSNE